METGKTGLPTETSVKAGKPAFAAGRYLKYAIGEIVLVVIGILIALQINNWNEEQKKSRWEQQFLTDLRNELLNDQVQLTHVYSIQLAKGDACEQSIVLLQTKNPENKAALDSIFSFSQRQNPTFFPTTGVYDSGMSAGKIESLQNDALKYAIMNLYNHFYKRMVYNGEILDDVVERVDWEKRNYYVKNQAKTRSWDKAMDFEFEAMITFLMDQNRVYTGLASKNLQQIDQIIKMIDQEISSKN